jgi:acyl-CoA reductase-like NAD-dependent aldehyde dehydrogenase
MLEVRDPADVRSVVAEVPAMTAAEVATAYGRARAAFEAWRRVNPLDRAAVLARAAGLIRSRAEDGAVTLVRENGKTLAEARIEVTKTADFLDYYASFARQPWGELLADARPGTATSVRVEPVGVVLAICPWNDPLITPALTAANQFIDLAEAGQVAVNLPTAGWDVHHPFGGFRESGSPFKEQGSPGLRFYTRIKTSAVRFAW